MRPTMTGALAVAILAAAPALAQDPVELRLATIFDAATTTKWEPVIAAFEEANPGVTVSIESVAGSGAAMYPDVLRTAMASGDPPDVFFMWGGTTAGPFVRADQVRPLNDLYDQYGWRDRFPPWIVDRLSVDGEVYGVPFNGQGMGFFYRKDIFDANGLAVPTTYAEMEQACTTLKEAGVSCATTGGKFGWHVMRLVDWFLETSCGPRIHDGLNALTERWDQDCVVQAYQKLDDWVKNEWLVPDFLNVAPDDSRFALYQGRAAMSLDGPWLENAIIDAGLDSSAYGFFIPPTDQEPARFSAFPEQWMVSQGGQNQEEAAKLIDFVTSASTINQFRDAFDTNITIGVEPNCETLPITCQVVELVQSDRPTYPPTDQAFEKELMDSFFEVQDGIIAGQLTPAEGAQRMQERAEAWKASQG